MSLTCVRGQPVSRYTYLLPSFVPASYYPSFPGPSESDFADLELDLQSEVAFFSFSFFLWPFLRLFLILFLWFGVWLSFLFSRMELESQRKKKRAELRSL
jgi:hypothetical protein